MCVCEFVVYVIFSASLHVVAAFWAVHGLHLNIPVAAYAGVCGSVGVCLPKIYVQEQYTHTHTNSHTHAFPARHTRQTTQKFCIFRAALKEKKRNKNI